jgi:hypothetical protein
MSISLSLEMEHLLSRTASLLVPSGERFYASGNTTLTTIAEATYVIDQSERCGYTVTALLAF